MRSGPGTGHQLVVSIPAGSSGVSLGACQDPDDGRSTQKWCRADWNGNSGWISTGGLAKAEQPPASKRRARLDPEDEAQPPEMVEQQIKEENEQRTQSSSAGSSQACIGYGQSYNFFNTYLGRRDSRLCFKQQCCPPFE